MSKATLMGPSHPNIAADHIEQLRDPQSRDTYTSGWRDVNASKEVQQICALAQGRRLSDQFRYVVIGFPSSPPPSIEQPT
jgi:hypothetical protein